MSVWALLVAAGSGERLGEERPKAFVGLGELPLLAEPLRRLDESGWVDAIVVAVPAGLGGAGDPARRGARPRRRSSPPSPAARRGPSRCARRSPRCRTTRSSCSSTTPRRPLVTDAVIERVLAPLSEGWDGVVPALPLVGHRQARRRRPRHRHASTRAGSSPCRRRRRSSRPTLRAAYAGELGRRDGLRLARRGARRPDQVGRRRPAAAEGDDPRRPGAGRVVAVRAVVFDVGETLIDETRHVGACGRRSPGCLASLSWASLGGLAARG